MNQRTVLAILLSMTVCACHAVNPDSSSADEEESPDTGMDMKILAQNNADFAFRIYSQIRECEGNIFMSPLSVSTALAMAYSGARGETESQMSQALSFKLPQNRVNDGFSKLMSEINSINSPQKCEILSANAIWPQKGYSFLDSYVSIVRDNYASQVIALDYSDKSSAGQINAWVSEKTKGKISRLVDSLDPLVRLVLTNAIYFKGEWGAKFNPDKTRTAAFKVAEGKTTDVQMMTQKGDFRYFEDDELQALELPYCINRLSMIVLLPKDMNRLGELESKLDSAKFAEIVSRLAKREIEVFLPKFKIESELMRLNTALQKLGMKDAFSEAANFSGMTGERDLFISEVLHKAVVDVSEEGTEAAAATAVVMKLTAVMEKTVFRADHPFIFVIRDSETGSIIFIGRLSAPA